MLQEQSNYSDREDESCESDSLFEEENQEKCQSQLTDKPVPTDDKGGICTQTDDLALLTFIESDPQDRALELLRGDHLFSQDGLNNALISACRRGYTFLVQKLVDLGANVQYKDTSGNTPLMICAENSFIDTVRFLMTKEADVNAVNSTGDTALILSIRSTGSTEMTKVLLEQPGININHQNRAGYTALRKAVEAKDIIKMEILLQESHRQTAKELRYCDPVLKIGFSGEFVNNKGQSTQNIADKNELGNIFKIQKNLNDTGLPPLIVAFESGDTESFNILLETQCDGQNWSMKETVIQLFQKDLKSFYDTELLMVEKLLECGEFLGGSVGYRLMIDSIEAGNYPLVQLLCKHGVQLESHTGPLEAAARNGRYDLLELLLSYKAAVNQVQFHYSPLDCALKNGHLDCADLLIRHGAKMNIESALMSAVSHQSVKYMSFVLTNYKEESQKCMLNNKDKCTNLIISAAREGNLEIIDLILNAGADVNQSTDTGLNALVKSKNGEVAQLLIQRGADVNQRLESKTNGTSTPLLTVLNTRPSYNSDVVDIVRVMLVNGASANEKDRSGKTPLRLIAPREGNENLLKILSDHGADLCERDAEGNTALILAVCGNCPQNASCLLQFSHTQDFINAQNNQGSTALMYAVIGRFFDMMKDLLNHGACVNPVELISIIRNGCEEVIPDLIRNGLRPVEVQPDQISNIITGFSGVSTISPLCLVLLLDNAKLARYFMENMFLTHSDVSSLMHNQNLRRFLETKGYQECLDFLDEIFSQPISLFKLAFVAVASALGTSPGCENRVNLLPLPQLMKDRLMFKIEDSHLGN